ncbi:MAG: ATP-binding protein [Candidatus Delongbacteria bacterium]|nr:ATP-binding protein [Candidatus Delongbacteria bacterium]
MKSHPFVLMIPSDFHRLEDTLTQLEAFFLSHHLDQDTVDNLVIASSEIISNAMEHGNHYDPDLQVSITIRMTPREIIIAIKDQGQGFTEKNIADPLLKDNLTKTEGRGIFITRHLVDHVQFNFTPTGTETILTKHLE